MYIYTCLRKPSKSLLNDRTPNFDYALYGTLEAIAFRIITSTIAALNKSLVLLSRWLVSLIEFSRVGQLHCCRVT